MRGSFWSYLKRHHLGLLALFFALGGTSFAAVNSLAPVNSVGTRQVINGSLGTVDMSATARTALKGNKGPRARRVRQAPLARPGPGTQGPRDPRGPSGPLPALPAAGCRGATRTR